MSPPPKSATHFTILGAFRAGFGAVVRHPLQFAAIGLFVGVPVGLFIQWTWAHLLHSGIRAFDLTYIIGIVIFGCAALTLVHATAASAVGAHLRSEPVTLRGCFKAGFAAMPRLLFMIAWVTVPLWLLVPIELMLWRAFTGLETAISVLALFLALPVVAPLAAGETGFRVFRRAWRLYAGARWRGLGAILLMLLVTAIVELLLILPPALIFSDAPLPSSITAILFSLGWAFASAPSGAAYWQQRNIQLALVPVFD